MDCFYVGRLCGTACAIWQLTAIDLRSSYAWAELVICPERQPSGSQTSKLARSQGPPRHRLAARARALR
jgi:hypothetical protein